MSRQYLESIRNPQPYPASDTDNPPSRSRTPVGPMNYSTPNNPPSRSRTPASVLELINPKPYPTAHYTYDNKVLKPTAVRGGDNQAYRDDEDKPKTKRLTKTRSTPRGTPADSDAESRYPSQPTNGYKGGSLSSLNLALQVADGQPIKKETAFDVEAGPQPAPRTTSIDSRPSDKHHKVASSTLGSKPIDTTSSSHPMTTREKREKMARAGGKDEEDWDDDEDEVWYKRHEKLLWLVFFLVVIFFALGLGLGLRNRDSGYTTGAFANTAGEECRFTCRNRALYTSRPSNPLIVFAIDGLPNDLFNYEQDYARNIKRMSQCGVHSYNVVPSFASTTYPNLWTILTGRYPENHGVISDYIRSTTRSSRVFEPRVSQEYLDESQWYKAKPLWQTAREQGVISASHSWIGNNMQNYDNDVRQTINSKPNYYQRYSSSLSAQDMIDTVMRWIEQDDVEKIPQYISVFFNEPGDTIRQYGYNSQEANDALREVDLAIGSLFDFLYDRQDLGCFNTMILSPSALVNTTCGNGNSNVKFLNQELTNTRGFEMTPAYLNTFASIQVNALDADDARDTNEELAAYLKCRFTAEGSVYTRDEMPARYHYSSDMIPDDVFVLMKDGKSIAMTPTNYEEQNCQYTSDGYDPNDEVEPKALFVGFGINFRENYRASEFETMEVYNLMTKLLGVTGEPNNGTDGALDHMLRSPGTFPTMSMELARESTCTFSNLDMSTYDTGCTCAPVNQNDPSAMARGQVVLSVSSGSAVRHIPFGAPRLLASVNPDSGSCKLYQSSYVMAYDKTLAISKYASFTLSPGFTTVTMPTNCLITDTRLAIGENPSCDTYGPQESISLAPDIQQSFLLQPELSVGSAHSGVITSNIIPMYSMFETDIWDGLTGLYRTWANLGSSMSINIVQGPIYDFNRDGVADPFSLISSSNAWAGQTVVPSHFFIIATRCANNTALDSCQANEVEMNAFILPHNNMGLPCQQTSLEGYLQEHRASVMDVERMSGLSFFSDWSMSDDVNTRRTITLKKTDIAYSLRTI